MSARSAVRTAAGTQFDPALVEVVLELIPLTGDGFAIFPCGAFGSAAGEELLVLGDDVFREDGDITAGGLDVQVPEQGRADVDGQSVIHQLGGEEPSEVLRREPDVSELRVLRDELVGCLADQFGKRRGRHSPLRTTLDGLKQVGQVLTPDPLVAVVSLADRDSAVCGAVPTDDLRDDMEQLRRHRDDTFPVALGRADDQQRDYLPAGPLVLPDTQVSQLCQFLGTQASQPQGLHGGPLPKSPVLQYRHPHEFTRCAVHRADQASSVFLPGRGNAQPCGSLEGEVPARSGRRSGVQQGTVPLPLFVDMPGEDRQQRLAVPGAAGHPLVDLPAALVEPAHILIPDGIGSGPDAPAFWFGDRPGVQVKIESPDREKRGFDIDAGFPAGKNLQPFLPLPDGLLGQPQVCLLRVDLLDRLPEQLH